MAFILGTVGAVIGLVAGFAILFFEIVWYVSRFFVSSSEYMYQSPGLLFSTLGTGVLATLSALVAVIALGLMAARTRLRAGALLLLASSFGMALVYPVMLVGFSGEFVWFLIFPILPAVLLIAAAVCALIARRAGESREPANVRANTES